MKFKHIHSLNENIKLDNGPYWFCFDCMLAEANGNVTGLKPERESEVRGGLKKFHETIGVPLMNFGSENGDDKSGELKFSKIPCDSCGTHLGGERFRFAADASHLKKESVKENLIKKFKQAL